MKLILALSDVGGLNQRNAFVADDFKASVIERTRLLPKIAHLRDHLAIPCRRRTEQPAKIDIDLFQFAAHPILRQRHKFVERRNWRVAAMDLDSCLERALRFAQEKRPGDSSLL